MHSTCTQSPKGKRAVAPLHYCIHFVQFLQKKARYFNRAVSYSDEAYRAKEAVHSKFMSKQKQLEQIAIHIVE